MGKKQHKSENAKGRSQDRRNESSWYRPLIIAVAVVAFAVGVYKLAIPTIIGVEIRIEPAMTGVLVSHEGTLLLPAEDIMIPYFAVTSVDLLPARPTLKKINGLDGLKTLMGSFSEEDGAEVRVYALDYRDPETKFVRLSTAEATYILTPTDAVNFVGIVLSQMKKP